MAQHYIKFSFHGDLAPWMHAPLLSVTSCITDTILYRWQEACGPKRITLKNDSAFGVVCLLQRKDRR
jgi:hypothetical protein